MPGQAARARRPVTSRQRGRSARRTRRVDRPSTRDTLSARRTTERVDSRQTRLDGVVPGGGGNERRPRNAFRAKQASGSDRLGNVTTRPTDVLAYPEAVGVASPPGGRKREGPSPAWAETAPAGSGRRRRLGPGPARDAPSPGNRHRRKGRPMPGIVDGRAGTQDGRIALVAECRILGAGGRAPDAGQGDAVRGAGGVSDQGGQPVGGGSAPRRPCGPVALCRPARPCPAACASARRRAADPRGDGRRRGPAWPAALGGAYREPSAPGRQRG